MKFNIFFFCSFNVYVNLLVVFLVGGYGFGVLFYGGCGCFFFLFFVFGFSVVVGIGSGFEFFGLFLFFCVVFVVVSWIFGLSYNDVEEY